MNRRAGIRRFFLGALIALLLANVYNLGGNQETRPFRVAPRKTLAIARESASWSVKAGFAVYEDLRKHLRGKRLTIPVRLDQLVWSLEEITRVDVDVTTTDRLELDGQFFRRLRRKATKAMTLTVGRNREELYVFVGAASVDRYVLTQYAGGQALMLMPEAMYRELQPKPLHRATP